MVIQEICVKEIVMAAALAVGLAGQQTGQQVASTASLPDAPGQQSQAIPDAPKPQVPELGPVAPGKGTTPTSNGAPTPAAAADTFQPEVGEALPASPKRPDTAHEDDGVAPDLPSTPIGADALPVYTERLRVNYVEVPFTVKDSKGRLVPGADVAGCAGV